MKKMVFTAVALAVGMMAMATETAYLQIRLTGASGQSSNVFLTEDSEHSSAFESGVDSEKMMSLANSKSVLIFGFQGSTPCEDIVTNDLTNLQLGFTTNMVDQNYTLTFIDKEGTIDLFDKATGLPVDLSAPYNFSVAAGLVGQKQILDRFVVKYVPGAPVALDACFNKDAKNLLKINANPWSEGKIVICDKNDAQVGDEYVGTTTNIDLSGLTAGERYFVKFFPTTDTSGKPAQKLVIVPVP